MDYEDVIKRATEKGWTVRNTNGGHRELRSPDGDSRVIASSTSSDHRAGQNLMAELRRNGLDVRKEQDMKAEKGLPARILRDYLRQHSESGHRMDELILVVHAGGVPTYNKPALSKMMQNLADKKEVHRTDYGVYKWGPAPPSFVAKDASHEVRVAMPPIKHEGDFIVADVDADMLALDEALAALGRIETVVRRNRETLKQLAALKQMLGGIK